MCNFLPDRSAALTSGKYFPEWYGSWKYAHLPDRAVFRFHSFENGGREVFRFPIRDRFRAVVRTVFFAAPEWNGGGRSFSPAHSLRFAPVLISFS